MCNTRKCKRITRNHAHVTASVIFPNKNERIATTTDYNKNVFTQNTWHWEDNIDFCLYEPISRRTQITDCLVVICQQFDYHSLVQKSILFFQAHAIRLCVLCANFYLISVFESIFGVLFVWCQNKIFTAVSIIVHNIKRWSRYLAINPINDYICGWCVVEGNAIHSLPWHTDNLCLGKKSVSI